MAADQEVKPVGNKKDGWEKAAIILGPIGALLTAITITAISIVASNALTKNQEKDAKTKLYTELMSRREDSESALRKDMFNSIMGSILKEKAHNSLDEDILQLELLTYNFHESLNLMPLFEYLSRRNNEENKGNPTLIKSNKLRLTKMAKAAIGKQVSSLQIVSTPILFTYNDTLVSYKRRREYKTDVVYKNNIDQSYDSNSDALTNGDETFCTYIDSVKNGNRYDSLKHVVRIKIVAYDTIDASVRVRMKIQTSYQGKTNSLLLPNETTNNYEFTISYFEFPMIDNTRLPNDMRLAVVLDNIGCYNSGTPDNKTARIELKAIFFPGSRSSLKEKPYFDDIVSKLLSKN